MLKNYFIIAIRNLARHKVYTFVNIAGLAIGLACCSLIFAYVQHELSYDTFHNKADRIYRVMKKVITEEGVAYYPTVSGPLAEAMAADFPQVEQTVRIAHWAYRGIAADASFFDVFDFPLLKGDPKTALEKPYSVVLTEAMVKRYFGAEDPMGKIVPIDSGTLQGDFTVTGVVEVPPYSTLQFEMLYAGRTPFRQPEGAYKDAWEKWIPFYYISPLETYLVLREGTDAQTIESQFPEFVERHLDQETRAKLTYVLQPLEKMYLHTGQAYGLQSGGGGGWVYGDARRVYVFFAIAGLILLIACVNFVNLATARSTHRAKEVGMRKVSGAQRFQLVGQFLGEAMLLVCIAFVFAAGLIELTLPHFNTFVGKDVFSNVGLKHYVIAPFVIVLIGLLAGSYPAFFLSAYEPVVVLKGARKAGSRGGWVKKGLVICQFAASIFLIVGTMMIYHQLHYMQIRDLGFDKTHMIEFNIFNRDRTLRQRYQAVKQAFLSHPNVLKATAHRFRIGVGAVSRAIETTDGRRFDVYQLGIDEDYMSTFDIDLIAGHPFEEGPVLLHEDILLNETAVKMLGMEDPIGQTITIDYAGTEKKNPKIIGVCKDFHFQNLRNKIKPLMLSLGPASQFSRMTVKVRSENLAETMAFLEKTWHTFVPDVPFRVAFTFVNEMIDREYSEEQRVGQMMSVFAGLAILVACLGLFGLAVFTVVQRTKEIGVRKVLGASVSRIVFLLSKEFVVLVLIANVIAWPVAYVASNSWLQNFAYRVDLAWWVFALGGMIALMIALGTVGYQAWKAARANPVEALRYE